MCRDVDAKSVPQSLSLLNWIFFRDSDHFDSAFQTLIKAMDTDLDYVHDHTRLIMRAVEWDRERRDNSFLLRGNDLREAEGWLVQGAGKEPKPTPLQTQYVFASRRAETKRQRIRRGALTFGLIVAIVLAVIALLQRNQAIEQAKIALGRQLAAQALLQQQGQGRQDELAALLARQAYLFSQDYQGNALGQVVGTLSKWVFGMQGNALSQVDNALRTVLSAYYFSSVLSGHEKSVSSVAFSPDGKTLTSGSWDTTIRLWIAQTETLADLVCKKIRRNLTQDEWRQFVGTDIPYEGTCQNLPIHPSFIKPVENL